MLSLYHVLSVPTGSELRERIIEGLEPPSFFSYCYYPLLSVHLLTITLPLLHSCSSVFLRPWSPPTPTHWCCAQIFIPPSSLSVFFSALKEHRRNTRVKRCAWRNFSRARRSKNKVKKSPLVTPPSYKRLEAHRKKLPAGGTTKKIPLVSKADQMRWGQSWLRRENLYLIVSVCLSLCVLVLLPLWDLLGVFEYRGDLILALMLLLCFIMFCWCLMFFNKSWKKECKRMSYYRHLNEEASGQIVINLFMETWICRWLIAGRQWRIFSTIDW